MEIVPLLAGLAAGGLILGALARLALPGPDPLSLLETMAVGLAATLISGLLVYLFTGAAAPIFLISFTVAVLIMYFIRRRRGGGLVSPGEHAPRDPGPYER